MYSISMALSSSSWEIMQAECGCPADRGPHGSCKHIAALCYALVDFSRFNTTPVAIFKFNMVLSPLHENYWVNLWAYYPTERKNSSIIVFMPVS